MEWLFDPTIWLGLLTLVILEIVLGIDNLIFIAILADKLPPRQRDRARIVGLSLALIMRLGLLSAVSWLVTWTTPLFSIGPFPFSGRDLVLLLGGLFLLFKSTTELHDRLEGKTHTHSQSKVYASFGVVVAQIVVLDAVFSLDAVITAVGMVNELGVMMAAVIISIMIMMWASKPLTAFVNAHPTVVVLCLSFLLMIGLSLVSEGLGFEIPKGYLYGAIGFSIMIEFFNQLARRNFMKLQSAIPLRDRTADAVLRLLGSRQRANGQEEEAPAAPQPEEHAFGIEERNMVSGVLSLGERSIRSIMTPRSDISWVDLDDDPDKIILQLRETPHSLMPVCRGDLDNIIGLARTKDLIGDLAATGAINEQGSLRQPIILPHSAGVLHAMAILKRSPGQLVLAVDEFGSIHGLLTPIDILEAIAGEFPDEDERPTVQADGENRWKIDGAADLHYLEQVLETHGLVTEDASYTSLAGLLLNRFENFPEPGAALEINGLRYEVAGVDGRRITTVIASRIPADAADEAEA